MTAAAIPSPWSFRDYRFFFVMRMTFAMASALLVTVIGWQVYDIARQTMSTQDAALWLGMIGLAQFVPLLILTPVSGYVADRFDRRLIVRTTLAMELVCAAILALAEGGQSMTMALLFGVAIVLGISRAFTGPALSSFAPNIVPPNVLPTAIAWSSIAWQTGAIIGPPLGGYLFAWSTPSAYGMATALIGTALVMSMLIRRIPRGNAGAVNPFRAVLDGLHYVRANRVVLGSISLDLFAVLLGGATALLPIYARDILHVGAEGLGHLRTAPAIGAALTAFVLTRMPLQRKVGVKMFGGVAVFGLATIVFGLSTSFWLSATSLVILGAGDMISIYVRSSLIQLHTPDAMRGRVSSVNGLFISASNELGEFESGIVAAAIGPVEAVVVGGVGALVVTGLWARWFPELWTADRLAPPGEKTAT